MSTADPRSWAWPAADSVNAWSNPYCSSARVVSDGEHTHRSEVSMHPVGCGWVLARTTAVGSPARPEPPPETVTFGATITRLARTPGTEISAIPTWAPRTGCGREASPVTVIRSQEYAPSGTRSGCGLPLARTRSVTRPAAVVTSTRLTAGPMNALSANVPWLTRAVTGRSKSIRIHGPSGPGKRPAAPLGRRAPARTEEGSGPLAQVAGMRPRADADEDAGTGR